MSSFPRLMITAGVVFIFIGIVLWGAGKMPWIGRLPGDLLVRKGNFSFYFPLTTCIVISLLATLLLNLFGRK